MPFAIVWMDLEIIILSEVSQREKAKCHMIPLICRTLKSDASELISKTAIDSEVENTLRVTKGERWGKDKLGIWD